MRDFRDAHSGSFYAKRDQISGVSYYFYQAGWGPLPALSGLGRADATTAVTWAA